MLRLFCGCQSQGCRMLPFPCTCSRQQRLPPPHRTRPHGAHHRRSERKLALHLTVDQGVGGGGAVMMLCNRTPLKWEGKKISRGCGLPLHTVTQQHRSCRKRRIRRAMRLVLVPIAAAAACSRPGAPGHEKPTALVDAEVAAAVLRVGFDCSCSGTLLLDGETLPEYW